MLGTPAARLSATYQRWTYPDLSGNAEHQVTQPLQLLLLGDLRDIARRPLRLSLLGRVDGDLEGQAFEQGELLLGYVEALQLGGLVDAWAGRRVVLDGTTTGGLDGAWIDLSGLPWVGVGGHVGRPVAFTDAVDPPDWSLGAHAWVQGLSWLHLELRYERQADDEPLGDVLRSRMGGDLLLALQDDWVGFAQADYESRTSTLERGRAGLRYRAAGPLRAEAEAFRYDPLFDPGSVFARLASDAHWGLTGRAGYDLLRNLTAQARWTTRVFKRRVYGATPAEDRLMPDPTHTAELGLVLRPMPAITTEANAGLTQGDEGASLLGSLSAGWRHQPLGLDARIGGYVNAHDRRFNDPSGILELFGDSGAGVQRNLATGGWVDLGFAPLAQLGFALRAEAYRDETAFRSVRLLARLSGYLY